MFFYHQLKNGESVAVSNVEEITINTQVVDSLTDTELVELLRWMSDKAKCKSEKIYQCCTIESAVKVTEEHENE